MYIMTCTINVTWCI